MITLLLDGTPHDFHPCEEGLYPLTEAFKVLGSPYIKRPGKYIQRSHGAVRHLCKVTRGIRAQTWSTREVFLDYCHWAGFESERVVSVKVDRVEKFFGEEVIENLFSGYEIQSQVYCGKYRLDWYIPELKLVVELDEATHRYYNQDEEKEREEYIKATLGVNILRYTM